MNGDKMEILKHINSAGLENILVQPDAEKNLMMITVSVMLLTILILLKVYSIKNIEQRTG